MKYIHLYTLFMVLVFHTSCGQNQTNVSKDNIKFETTDTLTSNIWDIKQDRKGNIWFAASDGVFRYDGKSFTKITGELISKPFCSILEDSKGNFWFGTFGSGVYYYDGKSFQNFTTREGLANNSVVPIYEDKAGIIWLGTGGGVSRYDGKSFQILQRRTDLPIMIFTLLFKTKQAKFGLEHGVIFQFTIGKKLPLSPIKTAKLSETYGV